MDDILDYSYPIHENLIQVFFSNATLKQVGEPDKDSCRIVAINNFIMGVPIQVTQGDVATTFDMLDSGCNDEHEGFLVSKLIPNDNALDLQLHARLLHFFIL